MQPTMLDVNFPVELEELRAPLAVEEIEQSFSASFALLPTRTLDEEPDSRKDSQF